VLVEASKSDNTKEVTCRDISNAYCAIAEIYLTDAWFAMILASLDLPAFLVFRVALCIVNWYSLELDSVVRDITEYVKLYVLWHKVTYLVLSADVL